MMTRLTNVNVRHKASMSWLKDESSPQDSGEENNHSLSFSRKNYSSLISQSISIGFHANHKQMLQQANIKV